jgi:hypothetical protein
MKRILTCCAVLLGCVAILSLPQNADACSTCDTEQAKCNAAINSRCYVYAYSKTVMACDTYYTSCAYAYAPAEISADGSIASLAALKAAESDGEQVRGCHGLIVDRAYSAARQAQARAGSKQIML